MTDVDDSQIMVGTVAAYRFDRDDLADAEIAQAIPRFETVATGIRGEGPCGYAMLVIKRGPNLGARFALDQPANLVGRHPDSDIFLDDVTVSRRHCEFRSIKGQFEITDAGSLNGTYVNREPVSTRLLDNGDEIQIGKFRLVFLVRPGN